MMKATVLNSMTFSIVDYEEKARDKWIFDWPAQVALTCTCIAWTADVSAAFAKLEEGHENAMKDYSRKQVKREAFLGRRKNPKGGGGVLGILKDFGEKPGGVGNDQKWLPLEMGEEGREHEINHQSLFLRILLLASLSSSASIWSISSPSCRFKT